MNRHISVFLAAFLTFFAADEALGNSVIVKGKVNSNSAKTIYEIFVQNSGLLVGPYTPEGYAVVLGVVENVAPEDAENVKAHLSDWLSKNQSMTGFLRLNLGKAHHFGKQIVILADYPPNQLFRTNKAMQKHLEEFSGAQGAKYRFSQGTSSDFTPHLTVGVQGDKSICETLKVINDRMEHDQLISEYCSLYSHPIDAISVETARD